MSYSAASLAVDTYEYNSEARSLALSSPTTTSTSTSTRGAGFVAPDPHPHHHPYSYSYPHPHQHSPQSKSMAHTRSIHDSRMDSIVKGHDRTPLPSLRWQQSDMNDSATSSSQQTIPQSIANSQESNYTSSSDQPIASPASDDSATTDGARRRPGDSAVRTEPLHNATDKIDQLLHLSTIAAAQDRITLDSATSGNRKRKSDGDIRDPASSLSTPSLRGHARNVSTVSVASTTGSTIGELSAELKTRLSYAMVKVHLGLQTRSIEEVESLASQAISVPPSSTVLHRRQSSSISPDMTMSAAPVHTTHSAQDATIQRQRSDPRLGNAFANKASLAPPATIQASGSASSPRSYPRRNSTPLHAALLPSQSASPHTPGYPVPLSAHQSLSQRSCIADPILFSSQTRNAREQDAVETLLFMSSPNNSANLKHTFSPSASPNLSLSQASAKSTSTRHTFPGGPRKGLPSHRPAITQKKIEKSSGLLHASDSPMDLDSPQHSHYSPNRVTPRRRARGNSTHLRSALSLPVALGGGHSSTRRALRDEDIERMLDRVAAETGDSSDDEEIQIPRLKNGVAGVMGVRS